MKIESVLIANRGEIACRIIRTCNRLGIRTIAVFSEPDRSALHVKMADQAIALGGFDSTDSYLRIDKVVAAAKTAKVSAVHPGYGFLSENPTFAAALEKAGINLIGPSAKTMKALGDKIRAKELAKRCNVPTVPSFILKSGGVPAIKAIAKFGEEIGYPLLIKASAGGGGRGMRRIDTVSQIKETIVSASREADAFFGDGRIFVEKLLLHPRHIEVQLLGDSSGAVTHLYDRDCTLQRRHQKVVEESPAPHLPARVRAELLSSAIRLAEAAGYENAGTAEFLLDQTGGFYFLEVNSRLQVEHPVTEEHVGVDLIELQLGVAQGKTLRDLLPSPPLVEKKNVAIEVRICAEDPDHDFAPSTGRIELFSIPEDEGIRIDSGVDAGSVVRHYYDPLIAKIIATGADREDARLKLLSTLETSAITGVTTNIPYLTRLLRSTQFISCSHDTKIAEEYARPPAEELGILLRVAAIWSAARIFGSGENDAWSDLKGFRVAAPSLRTERVLLRGKAISVEVGQSTASSITCRASSGETAASFDIRFESKGDRFMTFVIGQDEIVLRHIRSGAREWIVIKGECFEVGLEPAQRTGRSSLTASGELISPLPGKILQIKAKKGAAIKAGETVFILESMKMEHSIAAPQSGVLTEIFTAPGRIVDSGAVLGRIASKQPKKEVKRKFKGRKK